ncbi:MAG: restriction endonuclease subunit S [Flavobacteriaceae bacterium]|nr:restriction endonuclease subunit S [Flavobacteriaceae bacterium]
MNYIKKLLNGQPVEWKTLGEVADYQQPTPHIVKSTEYSDNYKTPVLTAGQSFILGYTNEENGIYQADKKNPVIIFDDFTTSFHWVDFPFKVKSSAMKIITPKEGIDFRFVYHAMKTIKYKPEDHARQWISKYSKIPIPLPPLSVQRKIADILDKFTELKDNLNMELNKELGLRKKQYAYYREKLLTFDQNTPRKTLGEVCELANNKRKPIRADKRVAGNTPYYGANNIQDYVEGYTHDGEFLLIAEDGSASLENYSVQYVNGKFWANNHIHIITGKSDLNNRFLFHYLSQFNFIPYLNGGERAKLTKGNILQIPIPLPPLEEQQRIAGILDQFDKLINDISEGIPAEIHAREKQYEYYREKLLSFDAVSH